MDWIKRYADFVINRMILRPFGLKVSYRIGGNALEDMKALLSGHEVRYIVDGGAYRGDFSLGILSVFPTATVFAFEPQFASWSLLCEAAGVNPQIKVFRQALGSHCGEAVLHINKYPLTSSLSPSSAEGLKYFEGFVQPTGTEMVEVVTLRELAAKESLSCFDILKLDLQGYELEALRGLGDLVETVKLIFTEVEYVPLYEGCPLFSEIDQYLRRHDFCLYQLYGLVRSPIDGRLLYGDAVFVNERHISLGGLREDKRRPEGTGGGKGLGAEPATYPPLQRRLSALVFW